MFVARVVALALAIVASASATTGVALGVVGGKAVRITAAPWTVLVQEHGQPLCTGVIIDSSQILTAGHCVMSDNGDSAEPLPASDFGVEAGVSNDKEPLKSNHPQFRAVSVVRVMPGYIAGSTLTPANDLDAIGRDLAVLTLARRLDLSGDDAQAAYLPTAHTPKPRRVVGLVMAGFGDERPTGYYMNGALNEVVGATIRKGCGAGTVLCVFERRASACFGDSGSGAVEAGSRPTVVGIFSEGKSPCRPGENDYVLLASPRTLRFLQTSMQTSYSLGISDGSADAHTVIRPLPAIGIVCVILGALGIWRIRQGHERSRR